jgi:hypothetical protein
MPPRLALLPGGFENMGAGLEPKKKCGKPFHRDPTATEARIQVNLPYIVATHPKGRATRNESLGQSIFTDGSRFKDLNQKHPGDESPDMSPPGYRSPFGSGIQELNEEPKTED